MTLPTDPLLWINAISCTVIWLRLLTYTKKEGTQHSWSYSLFAYLIILITGSVTIRTVMGEYIIHDPSEAFLNLTLAIMVLVKRGNVAHFFKEGS